MARARTGSAEIPSVSPCSATTWCTAHPSGPTAHRPSSDCSPRAARTRVAGKTMSRLATTPSAPVGVAPSRWASRPVSHVRTPSPGMTIISGAKGSLLTGRESSSARTSASGSSDPATVSRNATTANYPRPVTAVAGEPAVRVSRRRRAWRRPSSA